MKGTDKSLGGGACLPGVLNSPSKRGGRWSLGVLSSPVEKGKVEISERLCAPSKVKQNRRREQEKEALYWWNRLLCAVPGGGVRSEKEIPD